MMFSELCCGQKDDQAEKTEQQAGDIEIAENDKADERQLSLSISDVDHCTESCVESGSEYKASSSSVIPMTIVKKVHTRSLSHPHPIRSAISIEHQSASRANTADTVNTMTSNGVSLNVSHTLRRQLSLNSPKISRSQSHRGHSKSLDFVQSSLKEAVNDDGDVLSDQVNQI
jgi:hypothetical protein